MKRQRNIAQWALMLPKVRLEELVAAYDDGRHLQAVWHALLGDGQIGNGEEAATVIFRRSIRSVCKRLNSVISPRFADADRVPPADSLRALVDAVLAVRRALGLGCPPVPPPKAVVAWWDEPSANGLGGWRYLVEGERKISDDRSTLYPVRWLVRLGDFRFDVNDRGELVRAVRR
jgi:hypothetical protein